MQVVEVTPVQVHARMDASDPALVLLDVREPEELAIARIDGAIHVPMEEIPAALDQLARERDYVVICHHGIRSAVICRFLTQSGYPRVANLQGGIDAWSVEVDAAIPRY